MKEFSGTVEQAGVLVRQRRKELGLSQTELAEKSGVSRKFVSDLELGHPRAELSKALDVMKAADIQVKFFATRPRRTAAKTDLGQLKRAYKTNVTEPPKGRA